MTMAMMDAVQILDGVALATEYGEALRERIAALCVRGARPCLSIVLVGDDAASALYVRLKMKKAEELGISCVLKTYRDGTPLAEIEDAITALNGDTSVQGVIVQLPLPVSYGDVKPQDLIAPEKDVDCLSAHNLLLLAKGVMPVGGPPPTPKAVVRLIAMSGVILSEVSTVVVGRGFFGTQIAQALRMCGAHVTVIDPRGDDMVMGLRAADVVVSAIGVPGSITREMVKSGVVMIDVGISKRDDKTMGDVDYVSVVEVARAITPVPGGVGPMTIMMLLGNVVLAAERAVDARM